MKEFVITEKGFFVGDIEQEIGSRHQYEELPAILVGKSIEVEPVISRSLEVATPSAQEAPAKRPYNRRQ